MGLLDRPWKENHVNLGRYSDYGILTRILRKDKRNLKICWHWYERLGLSQRGKIQIGQNLLVNAKDFKSSDSTTVIHGYC